jgi:hypothetical protein
MFNSTEINTTLCPHCQPQLYQMNGYEMIAKGDWSELIAHYGLSSIIVFILVFVFLHFSNMAIKNYYQRKYENRKR